MPHSKKLKITPEQAESVLEKWLGQPVNCREISHLSGGELHSVFALKYNRDPFIAVIKLRVPEEDSFEEEKLKLDYLHNKKALRVPQVYDAGIPDNIFPYSYLLMEHLPGITLESAKLSVDERKNIDRQLTEEIKKLHSNTRETFGQIDDDPGTRQWTDIIVPRLIDMRDEMQDKLPADVLSQINIAVDAAEGIFSQSQSLPTLIHGDLWAGNIMIDKKNGKLTISGFIDPGTQYADVEHELAYLQCFETVGQDFFNAYYAHTPKRPGSELRRLFYWLNTYMVHVWLFGANEYKDKAKIIAGEIVNQL